ncbi:hypothetical protein COOONC_14699 [Cooperia oncophora]
MLSECLIYVIFFKGRCHSPDNYEWTPLSYPATYEEKQSLIVTKIQQLREQNRATEIAAGKLTKDQIEAENTFEVGVWEPVVVELTNDENMPPTSFTGGDSLDTVVDISAPLERGARRSSAIVEDFFKRLYDV